MSQNTSFKKFFISFLSIISVLALINPKVLAADNSEQVLINHFNYQSPYFNNLNFLTGSSTSSASNSNGSMAANPTKIEKITYYTKNVNNKKVKVSGLFFKPTKSFLGNQDNALVVIAPGTQGEGYNCAVSKQLETAPGLSRGNMILEYEALAINTFLDKGFSVAVTDYIGLGEPYTHTYLNRVDQGHAVIDAAKAVIELPNSNIYEDTPVTFYGYSQGGGAVAAAAEIQPTYAPNLPLKAVFAGAPPANLNTISHTIDGSLLVAALGYAVNGFIADYPAAKAYFDNIFNAKGKEMVKLTRNQCVLDSMLKYGFSQTKDWFKNGKDFTYNIATHSLLNKLLSKQNLGNTKPNVPVYVYVNANDDLIVPSQAKALADNWISLGAKNIIYKQDTSLPKLPDKTLGNHFAALPTVPAEASNYFIKILN